jgi:Ca-activated chloride channel family protein
VHYEDGRKRTVRRRVEKWNVDLRLRRRTRITEFAELKLRPTTDAARARPDLGVVFVLDTSGSMREQVAGTRTRLDVVIEVLHGLSSSGKMVSNDRFALVHFDDNASTILGFTPGDQVGQIHAAVDQLGTYSGGTVMGEGLRHGLEAITPSGGAAERIVLLSDGQTADEDLVRGVASRLAERRIAVVAIGIGADWNVTLLVELANLTSGHPVLVVSDSDAPAYPTATPASRFGSLITEEFDRPAKEVVTDVEVTVRTVKEVSLARVTRVVPSLVEAQLGPVPVALGNVGAGEEPVFLFEFRLPSRVPSRVRVAQIGITYEVPGAGYKGELAPIDVVVEYSGDSPSKLFAPSQ